MSEEISQLGPPVLANRPQNQGQQSNNSSVQTTLLKVNGDVQAISTLWIIRVIVVILVIMIFLLYFALPPTFEQVNNEIAFANSPNTNCNPSLVDAAQKISCQNFTSSNPKLGLLVPNLIPHNQFLIYYLQLQVPQSIRLSFNMSQNVELQVYEVEQNKVNNNAQQLYARNLIYNNTYQFSLQNLRRYRSQIISQNPKVYRYWISFAFDRIEQFKSTKQDSYLITMKLTDYSQISALNKIFISAMKINRAYTIFTIVIRAVYLFLSIITAIIFLRRYCQLKPEDRILEIKIIALGSILLLFFNDPFYSLTILKINVVSTFFSSLFVVVMLLFLNFMWVFILRRIFYETDEKNTELLGLKRSWPFYLALFGLFISVMVLFNQYSYYILQNIPVITIQDLQSMKVIGTIVAVVLFLAGIIIYQLVMFGRIIHKNCQQPFTMNRHINFIVFYPFFMLMFVVFFAVGGSMPYSLEGAWVLYGYSYINMYMFLLQYLYYTPSEQLSKAGMPLSNIKLDNSSNSIGIGKSRMQQNPHQQQQIQIETDLQEDQSNKNQ